MDLAIDVNFDGVLARREQDLVDFENIIGQNEFAGPANSREDIPLAWSQFRYARRPPGDAAHPGIDIPLLRLLFRRDQGYGSFRPAYRAPSDDRRAWR